MKRGILHLTWRGQPGRRGGSAGPPSLPPATLETSSVLSLGIRYLRSGKRTVPATIPGEGASVTWPENKEFVNNESHLKMKRSTTLRVGDVSSPREF